MDPITAAANRFLREHETAWRAPPEQEPPAILRLDSEPSERRSVIKALRLLEWQPENRHPISIFEEPFEDMGKYLAAAIEHVRRDVRSVDEGLIADGQPRRALPAAPPTSGPVEA